MAVLLLLVVLAVQAGTGLVLAGTDLFYPPFGRWIAQWVAAPGVDPAGLIPYAPEMYDKIAFDGMRAFRKPFAVVHVYSFYLLLVLVVVHVTAVVVTEVKEGANSISAMFTGSKIMPGRPVDKIDDAS
jgi:cytochrome b